MRIVAGTFRGRALTPLGKGDEAARLRPTADRVRESLFNVLTHRHPIAGARVLDLFSGTGALGLEALSRGAAHVTLVENGRTGARLITRNIAQLGAEAQAQLLHRDALRLGPCAHPPYDLLFLDPPYGRGLGEKALTGAASGGWIRQGAMIVWEESAAMQPPGGFTAENTRRYGDTHVTLLRYAGPNPV